MDPERLFGSDRSLSSKVVSQYSSLLSPMAVDCVLKVLDPARPELYAAFLTSRSLARLQPWFDNFLYNLQRVSQHASTGLPLF